MNKFPLCKYCNAGPFDRSCTSQNCVVSQVANDLYYCWQLFRDRADRKMQMHHVFDRYCNKTSPFGRFNLKQQNVINETKYVIKAIELYLPELHDIFQTYSLLKN